jgi:hypothetical protein
VNLSPSDKEPSRDLLSLATSAAVGAADVTGTIAGAAIDSGRRLVPQYSQNETPSAFGFPQDEHTIAKLLSNSLIPLIAPSA